MASSRAPFRVSRAHAVGAAAASVVGAALRRHRDDPRARGGRRDGGAARPACRGSGQGGAGGGARRARQPERDWLLRDGPRLGGLRHHRRPCRRQRRARLGGAHHRRAPAASTGPRPIRTPRSWRSTPTRISPSCGSTGWAPTTSPRSGSRPSPVADEAILSYGFPASSLASRSGMVSKPGKVLSLVKFPVVDRRTGEVLRNDAIDGLLISSEIEPGFSGGPTCNERGEVVGVNVTKDTVHRAQNGAVAVSAVKQLLAQVPARGTVKDPDAGDVSALLARIQTEYLLLPVERRWSAREQDYVSGSDLPRLQELITAVRRLEDDIDAGLEDQAVRPGDARGRAGSPSGATARDVHRPDDAQGSGRLRAASAQPAGVLRGSGPARRRRHRRARQGGRRALRRARVPPARLGHDRARAALGGQGARGHGGQDRQRGPRAPRLQGVDALRGDRPRRGRVARHRRRAPSPQGLRQRGAAPRACRSCRTRRPRSSPGAGTAASHARRTTSATAGRRHGDRRDARGLHRHRRRRRA